MRPLAVRRRIESGAEFLDQVHLQKISKASDRPGLEPARSIGSVAAGALELPAELVPAAARANWRIEAAIGPGFADPSVAIRSAADVAVAWTLTVRSVDAGNAPFGPPAIARMRAPGAGLQRLVTPAVGDPRRAFRPLAAYAPDRRIALLWQEEPARYRGLQGQTPDACSRRSRLPMTPGAARVQQLGSRRSREPQVAAGSRSLLAVWDEGGSWVAARARHGGAFRCIRAPRGGPARDHDFVTNRALAAAGPHVALAWEARDHSIRAAIGRF